MTVSLSPPVKGRFGVYRFRPGGKNSYPIAQLIELNDLFSQAIGVARASEYDDHLVIDLDTGECYT